ncbi:ORF6N domain-containing protein [Salmonella enterica subsp. enterica]|uniref:ORF6N domain-containing protein n=2 Tax=Salmonella enterica TaxID=28901 RepID=UPI0012D0399A|nr:ORF6N domain-containing protein [Salmonella enterica]EBG6922930.1 ORF6N domain-containing protein [Salmonella enterica subsp. enterica]EBW9496401.1 ORF6N domain-containing protein [Salmonella enterica subsp. enterica serovar Brandenburg]ECB7382936.1 ORF6N domain-containing protein [Salmonella enterica subsp. enterica serovar Brandenburg]ECN6005719.1 ORF6N domain-containing protein [Salmonella enterica subsp. enterica serovar Brandenburg]EIS1578215.1 ORF6N domain-containing protein [Salmonel
MTTQISVETLSPITHNQIPVITTELLARLYATKAEYIRRNHNRNEGRFIEGKHFFVAKGEALEKLKKSLRPFQEIAPNVRKLILWTERGAARHAKMLETEQAWEVFEKLEDCYFSQKPPSTKQEPMTEGDGRTLLIHFDAHGNVEFTEKVPDNAMVCTLERFRFYLEKHGWIVVHKEQLVERLLKL